MNSRGTAFHMTRLTPVLVAACALLAAGTALPADAAPDDVRDNLRVVRPDGSSVAFSSWEEAGSRWTAVSKDGGATWPEPRAMVDTISLRAGALVPGVTSPVAAKTIPVADDNRVFLVQFETQSLSAWRDRLRGLGAEVLVFVPSNSHIVRMDAGLVRDVEALPFVRWVGSYDPAFRTDPELLAALDASDVMTTRYNLMTFVPGADDKARLAAEVQALGGQVVRANDSGYILEADLTDSQVLALLPSNDLQWIDEWSAPEEDMNNGRELAGADYVLSTPGGYDGTGVRAEVMDGGVDTDHPDFINPVPIHGNVSSTGTSHGTCTYGINFGTGSGSAPATGMAPGAYGYFAYYNALTNRYSHTAELVNPALPYQCVYQSNSWGSARTTQYTSISAEMDDIIWQSDIAIFQSQSNAGWQDSRPQAWAKNVISVGGAYHYNNADPNDDRWSSGASTGPAADGRIKPDLTFFYDSTYTTDADPGGYSSGAYTGTFGGTSGATPMVAGTSALLFQMWADDVWGTAPGAGSVFDERPHFTTTKALMINTANQYDWTLGGNNSDLTRVRQGWGYPDVQNAYDRAALTHVIDESSVLQALDKDIYNSVVPVGQDALKVTLVYADRAGTPGANPHRVNDVTLKVIAPDGVTEYWGNHGLDSSVWSSPGGSADTLNTVENVFIQNPTPGTWTIEVEAVEVNMDVHVETPEDDQDYALVIYGVTAVTDELFSDGFESGDTSAWGNWVP